MERYLVFGQLNVSDDDPNPNFGWNAFKGSFGNGQAARDLCILHYYDWMVPQPVNSVERWTDFQIIDSTTGEVRANKASWLEAKKFMIVREDCRDNKVTPKMAAAMMEGYAPWENYNLLVTCVPYENQDEDKVREAFCNFHKKAFAAFITKHFRL